MKVLQFGIRLDWIYVIEEESMWKSDAGRVIWTSMTTEERTWKLNLFFVSTIWRLHMLSECRISIITVCNKIRAEKFSDLSLSTIIRHCGGHNSRTIQLGKKEFSTAPWPTTKASLSSDFSQFFSDIIGSQKIERFSSNGLIFHTKFWTSKKILDSGSA